MTDSTQNVGTRPVADAHRFDVAALEEYLRGQIPGFRGPLEVAQFKGGQSNPTYKLDAGGRSFVLRRKPPGKLLPSAHAVDREYRVLTALAKTDVPVAHCYGLCRDDSVIGTMFYVMDFVAGRVLWDPTLPGMQPEERAALFGELNRVIAALHFVDYQDVGLGDFGKPGNYFARQIARWSKQYRASELDRIDAMHHLMAWLPEHIPPGDETCIVHGDYRLDNVIFHPAEPRILAVLDWELSTLGHPMADLSYHMMAWRLSGDDFRGLRGSNLAALGIPTERAYLDAYLRRTGRTRRPTEDEWRFYLAYNMFRLAAILQGVMARAVAGNAASAQAQDAGRRARPIAELGWAQVEPRAASQGT